MSQMRFRVTRWRDLRGFTLPEMLLVVAMLGILATVAFPRVSALLQRMNAGGAVSVVALDLEQALSLAARQRRPVRLQCDCAAGSYTVTDRVSGDTLLRRVVTGPDAGYGVTALAFSASPVEIFPSGRSSGPLTVTVTSATTNRQVTLSSGGFIRVIR